MYLGLKANIRASIEENYFFFMIVSMNPFILDASIQGNLQSFLKKQLVTHNSHLLHSHTVTSRATLSKRLCTEQHCSGQSWFPRTAAHVPVC